MTSQVIINPLMLLSTTENKLQDVDEMWKRQNTKGNVEMKDLVLGKNDTDNLCIFDKKWEWTWREKETKLTQRVPTSERRREEGIIPPTPPIVTMQCEITVGTLGPHILSP
ncbi:unnamed protein product [Leuciscus chuanchicus]